MTSDLELNSLAHWKDGWFEWCKFNSWSNGCMGVPQVQFVCSTCPSYGLWITLDYISTIYSATWGVIGASVSEPPSSEFNDDFCLLRRRSRLGTSCVWVRTVSGYELCLGACGVRVRTSYASVAHKTMSAALQRRRQQQRARNASERSNGGWQEQESCGYTTHGTSTGRRGLLVPFNDSSEYETTRTLAHTSLALAPTMVYIHLVIIIIYKEGPDNLSIAG